VVYVEALAVDTALQNATNFIVARPRPRTYAGDPAFVNSGEGYLSFYAGHVSTTFAGVVVAAYTIRKRYGEQVWPWIVGALIAAASRSSASRPAITSQRTSPSRLWSAPASASASPGFTSVAGTPTSRSPRSERTAWDSPAPSEARQGGRRGRKESRGRHQPERRQKHAQAGLGRVISSILATPRWTYNPETLSALEGTAKQLGRDRPDILVIVGGDGTVHQTLSKVLLEHERSPATPIPQILIIPIGTMNNLATTLGLTKHPAVKLAESVAAKIREKRPLDVTPLNPLKIKRRVWFSLRGRTSRELPAEVLRRPQAPRAEAGN